MRKRPVRPSKPDRANSDEGSEDENNLITKDGKKLTVAEFLADVELLKANKVPQNMTIGLHNSEF